MIRFFDLHHMNMRFFSSLNKRSLQHSNDMYGMHIPNQKFDSIRIQYFAI